LNSNFDYRRNQLRYSNIPQNSLISDILTKVIR
jgi:hypothetical protein